MTTIEPDQAGDSATPAAPTFRARVSPEPITTIGDLAKAQDRFGDEDSLRDGKTADDITHNNTCHAGCASTGLVAFARHAKLLTESLDDDIETVIIEQLTYLRHLVDALDLDYGLLDSLGQWHYQLDIFGK